MEKLKLTRHPNELREHYKERKRIYDIVLKKNP